MGYTTPALLYAAANRPQPFYQRARGQPARPRAVSCGIRRACRRADRCWHRRAPGWSPDETAHFQLADEARTVCIIASGPSVNAEDAGCCRGWPTIAVNDAWRLAPFAQVLYACDGEWWRVHHGEVRQGFSGELWTQDFPAAKRHGLQHVRGVCGEGLGRRPGVIHWGRSSGYQAINLAWQWGARRLVLLGFDCRPQGGQKHFFGNHKPPLSNNQPFDQWLQLFARLALDLKREGVEVINASPVSALTCWRHLPVRKALCRPAA